MRKTISLSIIMYIFITCFYGLITKFTFNNNLLFQIKTILPEILLILIVISSFIIILREKKLKEINTYTFFLILYISFLFIINLFTKPNFDSVAFVSRDLILPVLVLFFIQHIDLDNIGVIKKIIFIYKLFIILGFILAIVQCKMGWEWASKFYTGYSFYGLDEYSKMKVWHANGILRVPSLTGNSVTFGFYNLIAFLFIWKLEKNKLYKYVLVSLSILNIVLSTSKTSIIILLVIIFLNIFKKVNHYLKINLIILSGVLFIVILNILFNNNPNIFFSLNERLKHWSSYFSSMSLYEILVPLNLFKATAAGSGFLSFIDNTYLYFIISTGIVGLIIFMANLYKMKVESYKNSYLEILNYMIITFLIASIFVNITQGRSFFSVFCILSPILLKSNKKLKEMRSKL